MNFFTNEFKAAIKRIIEVQKNGEHFSKFLYDISEYAILNDEKNVFAPNIIIWDPFSQNTGIENLWCPLCFADTERKYILKATNEWTECQSNSRIPRTIWGPSWFSVIIGRIYVCDLRHNVVSYHAGILKQMPSIKIPFILTHDSGITTKLYDSIIRLVEIGTSFKSIQNIISENYIDEYMRRKLRLSIDFPLKQDTFKALCPGVNTIIRCFIYHYEVLKNCYQAYFDNVSFTSLSLDHTYKIAANVGFSVDKKWVKMYDTLFIAMNEKGMVKTFQFAKGTSFNKLEDVFRDLAKSNKSPKYIFVDNCCNVSKILNVFFPNSEVKLDLFHAVKRLTKHMPARHPFFSEAAKSVGLIFRELSDLGNTRCEPTPSPEKILKNLDKYLNKWKSINYNNWKIINNRVEDEFRKLRCHIEKGCLSNIPVGMGTNQNESLHRFIKQFGRSRLSVHTANAIITYIFYAANMKKSGMRVVPPIWSQFNTDEASFSEIATNDYTQAEDFFNIDKVDEPSDDCYFFESDHSRVIFFASVLYNINQKTTLDLCQKMYRFQSFQTLPMESWNLCDFIEKASTLDQLDLSDFKNIVEKINYSLNFELNCTILPMFLSTVKRLSLSLNLPQSLTDFILKIGDGDSDFVLSDILLDEFYGYRKELYGFEAFSREELNSKIDKNDNCIIGSTILALVNIFEIPVVLITTAIGLPMLPIFPQTCATNKPLFFAYNGRSRQFYSMSEVSKKKTQAVCYCGQKKSSSASADQNCFKNFRCSCLKNNLSCTVYCKCKNCGNNKPEAASHFHRRKRVPHRMSEFKQPTSLQYVMNLDEKIDFIDLIHHFLLESCLYFMLKDESHPSLVKSDDIIVRENLFQYYLTFYNDYADSLEGSTNMLYSQLSKETVYRWVNIRKKKALLFEQLKN